ncbi:autotransporter outer membrane beta-barrel domain-containing protein [Campylobacter pinnipediorum]|uniref:autotransporter outer membrane beta-barrel domain-containing protein n=1 Tax=Campylobacter pinnipediorum TaxID=1965231 RepID=UPI00084D09AE|nr:autotransporter outer membrane beta-barrel domain-containing protein [Campylobacter pinnipediorum]
MKISKIACRTLFGTMIAINAYGYETSLDKITNTQKEIQAKKQELKKIAQDEKVYTDKFKQDKKEAEDAKNQAEKEKKAAEGAKKSFEELKQDFEKLKKGFERSNKTDKKSLKALDDKILEQDKKITQNKEKITQKEQEIKQKKEEVDKADKALEAVKDPKAKAKIIADLDKEFDKKLDEAMKDRAKVIVADRSLRLNNNETQTVSSLLSVTNNNKVNDLLLKTKAEDIAILGKAINKSLEDTSSSFNNIDTIDAIISNTGLATQLRLAKLSNPLNEDLALAYAIKNLSDNKFADNGDTLSSVVKEYTNRFNYDSNLWGNIMGGKAKLKSQANINTYGFMLGYDKAFDNMIIGGYAGYTNAKSSSDTLTTKSDNYHFGAYTRMYIDQNEIDAKVSYGKGKNKLDRKVAIDSDFDANAKYNSKFFNTSIDYGYIFDINNNSFIKPMIGLEYSHINTKGFKETGKVPVSFKGTTVKTLSAKAAVEFRTYIANNNFLYITPGIQRELSKSMKDTELAFVNSTENIKYAANKDKHTFFTLKTGAEMRLTDALSTNINFGVKAKSKQQHYNGTVGLSYKF